MLLSLLVQMAVIVTFQLLYLTNKQNITEGLSIYPDHSNFEDNAKYLELGHKYGFSRIFMSMLEVKAVLQKLKPSTKK